MGQATCSSPAISPSRPVGARAFKSADRVDAADGLFHNLAEGLQVGVSWHDVDV